MKESVSWDPSLIKKFSSSNHYKLLNQLRNEVKKYPLNKKKNTTYIPTKETVSNKNKANMKKNFGRLLIPDRNRQLIAQIGL